MVKENVRFIGQIETITKDTLTDLRESVNERLAEISGTYKILVVSVQVIERKNGMFSAIIFSKEAC
jgi:hypothetical protein